MSETLIDADMNAEPKESSDPREVLSEYLDKNLAFVLKLAQAENLEDAEAIPSMARIIGEVTKKTGPDFMARLSGGENQSTTKLLPVEARERLDKAIDAFIEECNSK